MTSSPWQRSRLLYTNISSFETSSSGKQLQLVRT